MIRDHVQQYSTAKINLEKKKIKNPTEQSG